MKFRTLEELIAAWRQSETNDHGSCFFVLWADGTDGGGLTVSGQWDPDRRRWASMPLAEAILAIWQHLASDVKSMADIERQLSQYELMKKETRG